MKSNIHWNPAAHSPPQLRSDLDRLANGGRGFLQRWRMREELRSACSVALLASFVLPLLLLLVQLTRGLAGGVAADVSVWTILGVTIAGPAIYVLARVARAYYRYHPRRQNSLALYDYELKTQDRLVTADEFLSEAPEAIGPEAIGDRSVGFKQAAIADTERYSREALAAALSPLSVPGWNVRPVSLWGVVAAAIVGLALFLGMDGSSLSAKANERALLAALEASVATNTTEKERAAARKLVQRLREQRKEQQLAMLEKQEAAQTKNRQSRNEKGAEGDSNSGSSAMAQSMSTSSEAAGEPSSQKNASKPKKPEEEKPEEPKTKDDKKKPKKKEQQKSSQTMMSATSGEGKMSMSNSNPAEFDMPEEEDKADTGSKQDDQDQEAEDEDEQQKANSASKPSLNDQKAPVNRDLSQGMVKKGPEEMPKNGRSGPGALKKTRGVPSMILGIPVPDRVQGMPNPGRSKVTQEDAKPKEESHPALEAQVRLARGDVIGQVRHPVLLPWMRSLVVGYFMTLRQKLELDSAPREDETDQSLTGLSSDARSAGLKQLP